MYVTSVWEPGVQYGHAEFYEDPDKDVWGMTQPVFHDMYSM